MMDDWENPIRDILEAFDPPEEDWILVTLPDGLRLWDLIVDPKDAVRLQAHFDLPAVDPEGCLD